MQSADHDGAIGGFFALEVLDAGEPWHRGLMELSTGRGCLVAVLGHLRPARLHVPFFICDAVLQAVRAAKVEISFYGLGTDLLPSALPATAPDEALLLVNFFGIRTTELASRASAWRGPCIVDNTQAFFDEPLPGAWTFYSARKFFGVPDGAYLRGPDRLDIESLPQARPPIGHLYAKLVNEGPGAFEEYKHNEGAIDCQPRRMSRFSRGLLGKIDSEGARRRRVDNAWHLHEKLGALNRLPVPAVRGCAPFCYPLLLERPIEREALAAGGLYVPTFWKEVLDRPGAADFDWECRLASRLLPLPVDHRYERADMDMLVERLQPFLAG